MSSFLAVFLGLESGVIYEFAKLLARSVLDLPSGENGLLLAIGPDADVAAHLLDSELIGSDKIIGVKLDLIRDKEKIPEIAEMIRNTYGFINLLTLNLSSASEQKSATALFDATLLFLKHFVRLVKPQGRILNITTPLLPLLFWECHKERQRALVTRSADIKDLRCAISNYQVSVTTDSSAALGWSVNKDGMMHLFNHCLFTLIARYRISLPHDDIIMLSVAPTLFPGEPVPPEILTRAANLLLWTCNAQFQLQQKASGKFLLGDHLVPLNANAEALIDLMSNYVPLTTLWQQAQEAARQRKEEKLTARAALKTGGIANMVSPRLLTPSPLAGLRPEPQTITTTGLPPSIMSTHESVVSSDQNSYHNTVSSTQHACTDAAFVGHREMTTNTVMQSQQRILETECVLLNQIPSGEPTLDCFAIQKTTLHCSLPLETGKVLVKLICVSVDPYMRGRMSGQKSYVDPFVLGKTIEGYAIGAVIESSHPDYQIGDFIQDILPWSNWHVHTPSRIVNRIKPEDARKIPLPYYLSVLGMPGLTAYLGFMKICKPRPGETLFVSSGAGAVGQLVGQLGKIEGLQVVGTAGSAEKCRYMLDELKFDHALNYKDFESAEALSLKLREVCPNGIDCYFDNVGGMQLEAAMMCANRYARFCECGMISQYNNTSAMDQYPLRSPTLILTKELTLKGMIVTSLVAKYGTEEFNARVSGLLMQDKLKYKIDNFSGTIADCPNALLRMLKGENFGKQVITIQG